MTDKEIFEKLEAEIERLENYENESVTSSDTRFGWIHGKTFALTSIRVLLDSMQKEPASGEQVNKSLISKHDDKTCKENGDSLTQEPVSEDLEQAIDTYLATYFGGEKEKQDWPFLKKMAIHFAAWQKEQLENNRLKHCDSITNEQAELEQGFIDQHLDKHQRMPTFLDAIEYGMRLQKEQMMAKAVDGVVHQHGNCKVASVYYNDPDNVPMAYYIPSEGVSEGDVVKIITIKEG